MSNRNKTPGVNGNYNAGSGDRNRIEDATSTARDRLSSLGSTASVKIDSNPLMALGVGAAIGAVLAAVLPASQREKELLGPLGSKISSASTDAVDRAREMGRQKFDEMAGEKVREFFGAGGGSSKT